MKNHQGVEETMYQMAARVWDYTGGNATRDPLLGAVLRGEAPAGDHRAVGKLLQELSQYGYDCGDVVAGAVFALAATLVYHQGKEAVRWDVPIEISFFKRS